MVDGSSVRRLSAGVKVSDVAHSQRLTEAELIQNWTWGHSGWICLLL